MDVATGSGGGASPSRQASADYLSIWGLGGAGLGSGRPNRTMKKNTCLSGIERHGLTEGRRVRLAGSSHYSLKNNCFRQSENNNVAAVPCFILRINFHLPGRFLIDDLYILWGIQAMKYKDAVKVIYF